MSDSGRDHEQVAGRDLHGFSFVAAQAKQPVAARHAERLVNTRVVVDIKIDSVAPAIAPAIGVEDGLDQRGGIVAAERDDLAIDKHRPPVVRNIAVVPKFYP